jgi:ubiquinone/menaquinone biosynthesis C-methylase UbiE
MNSEKAACSPGDDPRIAFFDALAESWDDRHPASEEATDRLCEHRDLLALSPGQDLLEVGCGTGKTTAWLAEQVAPGRVTAVDFSPKMIARACAKQIDADVRCLDVCRDALGERRYDVVFCLNCFPHFRDRSAALGNLARAMRHEGRLLVMHFAGSERVNRVHSAIEGPVASDMLPKSSAWPALLQSAALGPAMLLDEGDLFFLEARKAPRPRGT